MTLNPLQIDRVRSYFVTGLPQPGDGPNIPEPAARAAESLARAVPNGGGLAILTDELLYSVALSPSDVAQLAVAYRLIGPNAFSRVGCIYARQPVRGELVLVPTATSPSPDCAALNVDPRVVEALKMPEVFPSRLLKVRQCWVDLATELFVISGQATAADVDAAANAERITVDLSPFTGGGPNQPCHGSSCPGKPSLC